MSLIDIIIPWIATCTLIGVTGIAAFWIGARNQDRMMKKFNIKYISEEEKEQLK